MQGIVCQTCSPLIPFPYLPPWDCWLEMQPVYMVSQPTSRGLSAWVQLVYMVSQPTSMGLLARGAVCLYGFQTYPQGIVGQSCTLSIYLLGIVSLNAACLYGFPTYLQGIVGQRCSLFIRYLNISPGNFDQGCKLFKGFLNWPLVDCWPEMKPVLMLYKRTKRGVS